MSSDNITPKPKSGFQIDGVSVTQFLDGLKEVFQANASVCKYYFKMLDGLEPTKYSEVMNTVLTGTPTADMTLRIAQEQMRLDDSMEELLLSLMTKPFKHKVENSDHYQAHYLVDGNLPPTSRPYELFRSILYAYEQSASMNLWEDFSRALLALFDPSMRQKKNETYFQLKKRIIMAADEVAAKHLIVVSAISSNGLASATESNMTMRVRTLSRNQTTNYYASPDGRTVGSPVMLQPPSLNAPRRYTRRDIETPLRPVDQNTAFLAETPVAVGVGTEGAASAEPSVMNQFAVLTSSALYGESFQIHAFFRHVENQAFVDKFSKLNQVDKLRLTWEQLDVMQRQVEAVEKGRKKKSGYGRSLDFRRQSREGSPLTLQSNASSVMESRKDAAGSDKANRNRDKDKSAKVKFQEKDLEIRCNVCKQSGKHAENCRNITAKSK